MSSAVRNKDLPDVIPVMNPFELKTEESNIMFAARSFKASLYGNLHRDQQIKKNVRLFIARELRPRLKDWFDTLSKDDGSQIKQLMLVTERVESVIVKILNDLNASHLEELIKKETASILFDSVEIEMYIPKAVSLLYNSHKIFQQTDTFRNTNLHEIIKEMSNYNRNLEITTDSNQIFENFVNALKTLLSSWLGFKAFLMRSLTIAYATIASGYYCEIYKNSSNLSLEDYQAVEDAMNLWIREFPNNEEIEVLEKLVEDVKVLVYKKIIDELSPKVYSIIIDGWPKTSPTIETLQFCLSHSHNYGRPEMINSLLQAVRTRLLTVQENTSVILDGYANCVHALKAMDPSCSFMHHVCGEIKEFLKKRPDTVRKIIQYITTVKRDQLTEYLGNNPGAVIDEEDFVGTNDEFLPDSLDTTGWRSWIPDPPDAPFGKSSHLKRSADVFNMLISVYGSKEMFVKEYRKLLSKRLTSFGDKDSSFELRYLDVLKQRFNEGELVQCEVMLKDVEDSQKIDIIASQTQEIPVTSTVISSHFWPLPDFDESAEFPKELEEGLEFYSDVYNRTKVNKKLKWMKSWGWTEVSITLDNKTISRFVSNQHAVVLYLFMEKETWSPEEVAKKLGISKGNAHRRLEWWGNEGLLLQELPIEATSEVWTLVQNFKAIENKDNQADEESDEEDAAAIEDAADAADALEAYWIYTKNYIAQNESVKAERIHKIFKMFSSPSAQGPSLDVVNTFLFRKVKQNLLTYQSGSFRVVKENVIG